MLFCFIYQNIYLLLYLIYISQGSVEMLLKCGGTYNNHMIANCPQCVPVKKIFKIGQ